MWNSAERLGIVRPSAAEWTLLIVLGASLLALRTFRDSYLKIWVVGWAALLASHLAEHCLAAKFPAPFDQVVVHAAFVLAVGLLACAVLVYARMRDLILPLMVITPVLVGFAGARVLLWPDSVPLRVALEISYRFVLLTAAVSLLRARRGRWEPAAWLLALTLPMLHLGWSPFTDAVPLGASIAIEVAVGLSMLLVVFDEARGRTRRLIAMQRITEGITGAQQYGHIVDRALEELKYGMRVRGAWFRLVESGHLVATHAAGMTSDFLRDAGFAEISDSVSKILEHPGAHVTSRNDAGHEPKEALEHEKIRQVVTVPVLGGKAPVGLLMLGNSYGRQWTAEELEFLQACAKQIALGVENFRLLEQVLRSQRQWMNTFDSIHDIILAHDADYRIIKANQVLLGQLSQAAADVIGNSCESVLPHTFGEWTGCPYCAMGGDEEFTEGADPCFGGFSVVSTSSYTEQGSPQKGTIATAQSCWCSIWSRRSASIPNSARPSAKNLKPTIWCAISMSPCGARTGPCCWPRRAASLLAAELA